MQSSTLARAGLLLQGGGSYGVASENLETQTGLLAGAALLVDTVLVAAVGISAGVRALISAFPRMQPTYLFVVV